MVLCTDGEVDCDVDTSVALTCETVRACLFGRMFDRAVAIATLTPIQLARLFPGQRIIMARNLRRVGRRLRSDRVRAVLAEAPARVLFAAARHEDEAAQLSAAAAQYLGLRL